MSENNVKRLPEWIRSRSPLSASTEPVRRILERHRLNTVCQSAACPNLGRCFAEGTATFMILGSRCTRNCRFCAVDHGEPEPADASEPARLASAAHELGLRHVVVTSVTRDDLPDGGAGQFAGVIDALRGRCPGVTVEVLTPDFKGDRAAIDRVASAGPDVYNHNVETVPRLYSEVRPGADYRRSLEVLRAAKETNPRLLTKSGFMAGLGEEEREIEAVMADLRAAGCDMLTIGQYLRPSRSHLPVAEYVRPERFEAWAELARGMGFKHVASGPLVRSSFHAGESIRAGNDGGNPARA